MLTPNGKLQKTRLLQIRLLDSFELSCLVSKCFHLKQKFCGVFAADNFPRLSENCFAVVNASISTSSESHYLLICNYKKTIYFVDPLGQAVDCYHFLYTRMLQFCFEKKLFNSSDYNQFRTQTQNCVDSFVFILLILLSHIAICMDTAWMMMIYYDLLSIWCRTNQSV